MLEVIVAIVPGLALMAATSAWENLKEKKIDLYEVIYGRTQNHEPRN